MATGRLLGLSSEAMHHALSLAVVPNLCTYPTRAGELSMWKGFAGPNGARSGVFAALLAAEGLSGPYEPFDGEFGISKQTLGGTPYNVPLGSCYEDGKWGIVQTSIKTHPVRDSCQLPIDTALELRQRANLADSRPAAGLPRYPGQGVLLANASLVLKPYLDSRTGRLRLCMSTIDPLPRAVLPSA
jgi:2-methylcitrate dehydratase PrpD